MALSHTDLGNINDDDPRVFLWRVHFAGGVCSDNTATMFENNSEDPETVYEDLTEGNPSPLDEWVQDEAENALASATRPATEEDECTGPLCDPPINIGDLIIDVKKLDKSPIFNIESPLIQAGIRASLDRVLDDCDGALVNQYFDNPDAGPTPVPATCLS